MQIAEHVKGTAIKRRSMAAALALVASLFAAAAGADPGRPVAMVTPAGARVVQTSPAAQAVIGELNGSARVSVLRASLAAARTGGDLRRWALELQSIVHDRNGNYLFKLYLVLRKSDAPGARAFAELLAQEGIALGPSSGHFERLEHMDPLAPLPPEPASARAGATPMGQWVDAFVRADYDPSYKPSRPGSLSERLQLTYDDGSTLDIDIRLISDSYDPAPLHAMAYAYVGPGQRLFPLRLGRSTTPRLWRAKHEIALAAMYRSNQDYETLVGISVAGLMSNLPLGLVAPVQAPQSPRLGPQRARTVSAPRTTSPSNGQVSPRSAGARGAKGGRNFVQDLLSIKRQKGLGDIAAGTRAEAETIGRAWVNGKNVKRFDLADGGFGLTDGTRTFRLQFKPKDGLWKANFQENTFIPGRSKGIEVKNIHMTITDMMAP